MAILRARMVTQGQICSAVRARARRWVILPGLRVAPEQDRIYRVILPDQWVDQAQAQIAAQE
ncbi:MAG: hypothetical protein PHG40_02380 [Candidatus Omnitrophica bacterium]|nr:hypothetical protein [Candidatus Omnitrophota bacterium]